MQAFAQDRRVQIGACLLVFLLSAILFLYQLSAKPFWDYDEAIYANVVHDTLESGDFLTLHLGNGPWFEKPPLAFWTAIAADKIFHNPEFSYRLTAAIAGVLSVVLVMLITFEISGNLLLAALAGLIIVTTGTFLEAGREFRTDIPVISMMLLTGYAFLRGMRTPVWFLGIGVGLAIGFLFKSIISFLAVVFILAWSAYRRDFSWIRSRYIWIAAAVFFAILAPWYIYEYLQYGQVFLDASILENLSHFHSDIQTQSYSLQDYINFFITYAAPWTTLFVILSIWLGINFKKNRDRDLRDIFIFCSTAIVLFIVFALARTKILSYLLPIYPYAAIAVALSVGYFAKRFQANTSLMRAGAAILCALSVLAIWITIYFGFHIFPIVAVNDLITKEEKEAAMIIARESPALGLYAYEYNYYDTVEYYSGRKSIQGMSDDQALSEPFLLLVSKPYMDWHSFPPELQAHLDTLYKGQTLILYKFRP